MRLWLLLLLAATCLFAFQNPLQQAVALTRQGDYARARLVLKDVAEPADTNQRVAFHRLKAAIASGLSDFSDAAKEMHLALQLAPADPNLTLATAAAELKANQLAPALEHARSGGDTAIASALVGDIEEKRGDTPAAIEAYRHAAELAPDQDQYRIALASELIEHQAFGAAIDVLDGARSQFSNSAKLLVLLGIARYGAGDTNEAIETLTDATTLKPALPASFFCLSQIVLQTSVQPPEKTFASLCAWNTTVCAALQLRKARETSDDALAQRAIDQLQHAPPANSVAHCALGRAYEWRQELAGARRELELCVAEDPSPQNHYVLGLLYRRLGEVDLSRREIAAREILLRKMSEETATGLTALHRLTGSQ
jgi:tetratricopeptide (TPR) repeat protein